MTRFANVMVTYLASLGTLVSAVVPVTPQLTCAFSTLLVRKERNTGSGSVSCRAILPQSMLLRSSRGGVPVFSRPIDNPRSRMRSARRTDAASRIRPPSLRRRPTWSTPRRKVPVVNTTALEESLDPSAISTPAIRPAS